MAAQPGLTGTSLTWSRPQRLTKIGTGYKMTIRTFLAGTKNWRWVWRELFVGEGQGWLRMDDICPAVHARYTVYNEGSGPGTHQTMQLGDQQKRADD